MGKDHDMMRHTIKEIIVPFLRSIEFKGSFPNFKRISKDKADFINFQFSQFGKKFAINIAICSPNGVTSANGTKISIEKVKIRNIYYPNNIRLCETEKVKDYWFDYEDGDYYKVAKEAETMIKKTAISWWDSKI